MPGVLACLLALWLPAAAVAQGAGENADSTASAGPEKQRIEELVSTLENPAEREALVDNLKTLLEQQSADDSSPLEVSQWLQIEEKSSALADRYFSRLQELGLTPGESGRLLIAVALALVVALLVGVNHWLASWFNRKLERLRNRLKLSPHRFSLYFRIQAWFGYGLGASVLLYLLFQFTAGEASWLKEHFTASGLFTTFFSLLLVALLFASVWEWVNFAMEYGAARNRRLSRARLDTLLPVARNALLLILFVLAFLVVLSEMGLDIMPLLAGAGVLGIAIGFGAQTLVKELINGFIVIFEDLVSVGDVVRVGDRVGVVERITIRKVQLRDLDGTVSTVPFSEVNIIDNLTKDYSYYLMDVGVAYRENVDEVMACLREVDADLRGDEDFGGSILAELEILGVNEFADSAVVIRCRTKTQAHDKWRVGREFNRRMKAAFDERGIEIPFPHQTLYFGEDKKGNAPAGRIRLLEEQTPEEDDKEQEDFPEAASHSEDAGKLTGEKKDSARATREKRREDNS